MAKGDASDLKWVTLFDNANKKAAKAAEEIPDLPSPDAKKPAKKKLSVERIYQKKTQLEHILLRPDTYVGSVEPVTTNMWLFDQETEGMVQREITYVPGLYKIFDEIVVNAADNKQRDAKMNCIKIDINQETNKIKIWNNGKGIPIVEHKTEKMYVPTLIFGHLLTSSNYNDEERKVTGGRNGYGAKLCNIFSSKFTVETSCKQYGKKFKQSWNKNMSKATDPVISENSAEDYTCITFCPDLEKFKMEKLEDDIVSLFTRRAYDIAASSKGVKVFLNGKKLPIKNFREYIDLFLKGKTDDTGQPLKVVHEQVNERWEVAVTLSEKGYQQASFVNSIATTKGGRHVDYITDQVVNKLIENVKKKGGKGNITVKPFQIKTHLWVFVNCLIENPTFDSQTKENMTKQAKGFGSTCKLTDKFMLNVSKCGIIESILSWMKFKAQSQLNKKCHGSKHSKLKGVPKLDDANEAGTKNSHQCTLILTEGDSAKTLAVAGLGVVGRDHYGVFPLKGKVLNVREASHKQIMENAEVNNIIKILGLQYKKSYDDADALKTLRYGKLMIMTDQDQDGSHIKGLLINFIHHNWPSLLRHRFLEEFITPIVKVSKGNIEHSFYSLPEFEEWKKDTENWHTYKVKYYKGLGTSTAKEAKDYFSDMNRHRIPFKYVGPEDDSSIVLAFSKKKIEERKEWLRNWMEERKRRAEMGLPEIYIYGKDTKHLTYNEFVNRELILFSNMDNERSIPSMCDGLKPGQRKVLFTCFKRNLVKELKVAQLAGSVAELSAYHHGETSLMGTIVNLAQNFVGSNNINLLQPIGQFGTRLHGGKDSASPRYIFTALSPLARLLFPQNDEPLLKACYDDSVKIEPEWYLPIIPMVLVNGAEGIGTGWSTKIPNYDPREIVANIRRLLDGDELVTMKPAYKNFKGSVDEIEEQRYITNGEIAIVDDTTVEITELPIRSWTQAYKESVLEPMLYGTEKTPAQITDYKEYHTDTTVKFVIKMSADKLLQAEEKGLHSFFKLQSSMTTTSMVLFDHMGVMRRYNNVEEIMREFYGVRLDYYQRRKDYLEGMLAAESLRLDNQARFICEKIEGKLKIENLPKKELIQLLVRRGYDSDPVKAWKEAQSKLENDSQEDTDDDNESEASTASGGGPDYNYILNMTLWSLSKERKEELIKQRDAKAREIEILRGKTNSDLWREDLDKFMEQLDFVELQEREEEKGNKKLLPSKSGKGRPKPRKPTVETLPSPMGRRVEPRIDHLKKAEAAKRGKAAKKAIKEELDNSGQSKMEDFFGGGTEDSQDSKDSKEPLSLAERLGLNKDKPTAAAKKKTQSKLSFKTLSSSPKKSPSPKKKAKKRNPWSSDSENESDDDDSDAESTDVIIPREKGPRRAAAATKTKYALSGSESDDPMVSDDESFNPGASGDEDDSFTAMQNKKKPASKKTTVAAISSDEEDDAPSQANTQSSAPVTISDDEDEPPAKKPAPKKKPAAKKKAELSDSGAENEAPKKAAPKKKALGKKPAAPKKDDKPKKPKAAPKRKKKMTSDDSDSDEGFSKKKPKKSTAASKKKAMDSDSDDSDFNDGTPPPKRATTGRARPAAKYTYDDNSDSDFDF